MIKKIGIISGILCAIFFLWYFKIQLIDLFLKSEKIVIKNDSPREVLVDKAEKEKLLIEDIIARGEIKMAFRKEANKIIYYNQNNFLETDLNGSYKNNLGSYPFNDFKTAQFSKTGSFCLVRAGDDFNVYNLEKKQNIKLEKKIKQVRFNSLGDGLIYLFSENGFFELNISDLEGKNWRLVRKIKRENLDLAVNPQEDLVAYFSRQANKEQSGIFLTNLIDQKANNKIVEKDIIDVLWSPDGDKILFSFYDHSVASKRVQLGYYDLLQKKQFELGVPSVAQKCVWSEEADFLYCAVLTSEVLKEFKLEDWYSDKFVSRDIFWKIDLNENKKEKIFTDLEKYPPVDAFNLILTKEKLVFIDKISGSLIKRPL